MRAADADFFERRAISQEPHFLFIGCCDSRVPAELLTGAHPGEIFVHRNIANQADPTDMNMLSALEYAVEVLDVKHVLVCGHYECGGVRAAMEPMGHRLVDHWLQVVRDLQLRHQSELAELPDAEARFRRLVELNVLEQVFQLSRTPIVRHAWARGRRPLLHGLVYDVHDGRLRELVSGVDGEDRALELREAVMRERVTVPPSLHVANDG
ncbi:MAG: carbonic anhydrase [Gemmatimonadaceae bacterium]|nr:carbonic anhydrase [Gemmatimonadaceae bacterium]